ncbi:hypothetical protein PI124_g2739 [Phytophthora idaei]|nr:hypothetical protein PI125_g7051 [Phytophthora idaei]KAG3252660.1 hypothetical protein PI124_g2739 [Phytophthora idaei]
MVERFVKLQPVIVQLDHDLLIEHEVQTLLSRCAEHGRVNALLQDLAVFEAVPKELQKSTLLCLLCDIALTKSSHPALKPQQSMAAAIVNNPNLKQRLVKLQRGEALTTTEKPVCVELKSPDFKRASSRGREECSIVRTAFKKRNARIMWTSRTSRPRLTSVSAYFLTRNWLPPIYGSGCLHQGSK